MNTSWLKVGYFMVMWIVSININAQNNTTKDQLDAKNQKLYQEAIKCSRQGKSDDAIKKFDAIIKKYPNFTEGKVRKATTLYDKNEMNSALSLYDECIAQDPKFSPEMYYSAAMIAIKIKNDDKAIAYLNEYLHQEQNNVEKKIKAKQSLDNIKFKEEAIANAADITLIKLSDNINSPSSEYLPAFTADGELMVFTRRYYGQEDILYSKKDGEDWTMAVELSDINTTDNEGAHTISADGTTIVFTACNRRGDYGGCDLYISHLINGAWSTPVNMGNKINTPAWESQPSLSPNGNTLYFSSNRSNGQGGSDLWKSTKNKNGSWSTPINLGSVINTTGNEESPFLHSDGKTLYFRSNGHPGMGSFDIFMSKWNKNSDEWSTPINLGYPINSEGDDGALTITLDGSKAYLASDRAYYDKDGKPSTDANLDIYYFNLPEKLRPEPMSYVKGSITDAADGKALACQYFTIDLSTGDTLISSTTNDKGQFIHALPIGKNYAFVVEKEGYSFHSENFNTSSLSTEFDPFLLSIKLNKIEENNNPAPVILNNVFFESDSYVLLPESDFEIEKLATILKSFPNKKVKIIGHTDNVGSNENNQVLSEKRAKAVVTSLESKGINISRMSYEGMGETKAIASNETEEGRKKNRRTEFILY